LGIEDPAPEADIGASPIDARAGVPNRRDDRIDEDAWEESLRAATKNPRAPGKVIPSLSTQDDACGAGMECAAVEMRAWVDVSREGRDDGHSSRNDGHASEKNAAWWEDDAPASGRDERASVEKSSRVAG
jgi:hypothetical protein